MNKWLCLLIGSIAGGFARYIFAGVVYDAAGSDFPYGTLAVNLTGCFLIGLFDSWSESKFLLGPNTRILLMTGFCGAYTTFSTFILETSHLARAGETGRALANVLISVLAGFLLFRAGAVLGEAL